MKHKQLPFLFILVGLLVSCLVSCESQRRITVDAHITQEHLQSQAPPCVWVIVKLNNKPNRTPAEDQALARAWENFERAYPRY